MVEPVFDYQFRLILVGNSTVGKSSLLKYFTDGRFGESSDPTVGVDFFARLVQLTDGTKIKLQLWDTAGQERFRSITRSYYRNSVGVLLAYDICSRESFEHIPQWMSEASQHIEPHSPVFVLIGCKKDKELNRVVSQEEAQAFADFYGMNFVETSAKHGENVECAFKLLTEEIYSRVQSGEYVVQEGWDGIKAGYVRVGLKGKAGESEKVSCC
ncbi:ras-related protein Rab-39B-like [Artemia franciscana]|uniref:Ras-related protein Rab-39B n=1 Tax=Artemia franciscana TaxID=6661 RepID=A0AA88HW86_ARTSF|nr:hypothetical protein QYM36_010740 [Artemia franciscana]